MKLPRERHSMPISLPHADGSSPPLRTCLSSFPLKVARPRGTVIGLIAFLLAASVAQPAEPSASITSNEVAQAAHLLALEFTPTEAAQAAANVNRQRETLVELHRESFQNSLAPALVFDPRPPGFKMPSGPDGTRWAQPTGVQLPTRREDLAFYSVAELSVLIRSRQLRSVDLTRFCLDRLKRYGPALHCVVTLTEERALDEARRADAELNAGRWRGPLHGIPYGAKDLLAVKGIRTTWGAPPFTNQVFDADATVIKNLGEAGAVLVAKLSLGELAMGDVWFGGLTRNPWKPDTGSSGSSAGSAAAVAAGLVPFALGSETLGSIVSPSTVCGVTGLRPTFGRVSRTGAMTLCWSMDKLGPLARSAGDCALVLDAIRGADGKDLSAINAPFRYVSGRSLKDLRIGVLQEYFDRDYGNRTNDLASLEVLRSLGARLRSVALPKIPKAPLYLILNAEAATAFDELTRNNLDDQLVQQDDGSWPNAFRSARFISAVDYLQANRLRTRLMAEMDALFADLDVLVAPTWMGNTLLYGNLTGHPCVVVPNGDKTGRAQASLCFLGKLFGEGEALEAAAAYQAATKWHRQLPNLSGLEAAK
jgi:Asp-tRNA(Asn)/Glu-tRNA(Gln) amidotransferase A subunit family amidase